MKHNLRSILIYIRQKRTLDYYALVLGVAGYVGLTLFNMGTWSIWFDEAFSAYITRFNFAQIAHYTANDVHPPLYYWVLKVWTSLFGRSTEVDFRSLSMVFGAICIIFGFLLVRKLIGRKAAYLSLLFMLLSPMLIRYGQEARMYTMAAAIVMAGTYVFVHAQEKGSKKLWALYAILVAAGMWTNYFTLFAWITHWIWRLIVSYGLGLRGKKLVKSYFSKPWIISYAVAIALFLPWVPSVYAQFTNIQDQGFWIGPVTSDTLTNFLTNTFFYLDHDQVANKISLLFYALCAGYLYLGVTNFKYLKGKLRYNYLLIIVMSSLPVLFLFLVSLPPFRSSFVQRYLIYAIVSIAIMMGTTLAISIRRKTIVIASAVFVMTVCSLLYGFYNINYYGNYNKSNNTDIKTKFLVQKIDAMAPKGEPIIANSTWIFYEAVFYNTADHPVYYIAPDSYSYSSLDMLKDSSYHKISNLETFERQYPKVWYIGSTQNSDQLGTPDMSWKLIQSFTIHDSINNVDYYKAAEFSTGEK